MSCGLFIALIANVVNTFALSSPNAIDFSREIQPILAKHCFQCHGPDAAERQAGLRLDRRSGAITVLPSGASAVVPGRSEESALLARVTARQSSRRMPPPGSHKPLTNSQIDRLRQWIDQGAKYERHWSFRVPEQQRPPSVINPAWLRDPFDAFVLARLQSADLHPSQPAAPAVWLRRVTLDLTGLPPTIEEIDAFLKDPSPVARAQVVDRLLASPAFGERWARVWLDLARYADSAGYAQDPERTIWLYRDWLIQALNANKPFDSFTIEQLAGDLLDHPTDQQRIATAFHRNTMTNSEGGTNDEEFRVAAVVDRVNTTFQTWMGLTVGCAQCHTHKYDPITQAEYYRLFAIFNNTADADRGNEAPTISTYPGSVRGRRNGLLAAIEKLERQIAKPSQANPPFPRGDLLGRYVRIELLGNAKVLHLAEVEVLARGENVALAGVAQQVSTAYEGIPQRAIDGNRDGDYFQGRSTTHTDTSDQPWWEVDLGEAFPIDKILVWNRTDGDLEKRLDHFRIVILDADRKPLWVRTVRKIPDPSLALQIPTSAQMMVVEDHSEREKYYRKQVRREGPQAQRLAKLRGELDQLAKVKTPILRELDAAQRRKTYIHIRGNYLVQGEEVAPGVLDSFHPLPSGVQADRLGLATWLISPENPLTARVTVNRIWEQLFGTGLVETSEDFGVQGELPSHPALLDYLAVELLKSGWDTKHLVRRIVLSATYAQTSRQSGSIAVDRDPKNRFLSRGPRFRLSAEMIRDQALAVGGLLSRKMFGPSVRPPQPKLGLKAAFGGSTDWNPSPGEDRYRRGLYTKIRRTTPYPSMLTFDAPSREVCTIRRLRTNTPLQALVTLNDPVFLEAAQGLARRVLALETDSLRARIGYLFKLCLSRSPSESESTRLIELYAGLEEHYHKEPQDALQVATNPLGSLPPGVEPARAAAWTVMGNVLLNLDEFLARP